MILRNGYEASHAIGLFNELDKRLAQCTARDMILVPLPEARLGVVGPEVVAFGYGPDVVKAIVGSHSRTELVAALRRANDC